MDDKTNPLVAIESKRVEIHHSALWEEEKHYTWWIYIIDESFRAQLENS